MNATLTAEEDLQAERQTLQEICDYFEIIKSITAHRAYPVTECDQVDTYVLSASSQASSTTNTAKEMAWFISETSACGKNFRSNHTKALIQRGNIKCDIDKMMQSAMNQMRYR